MTEQVVLFEMHSALLVAGAWRSVRRADRVIFSRRVPLLPVQARARDRAVSLVRLLNSRARIDELQVDALLDYLPLNAASVGVVDALAADLRRAPAVSRMIALTGSEDVLRYFQGSLAAQAANWGLFSRLASRLSDGVALTAVADWDTRTMADRFGPSPPFAGAAGASARRVLARWKATAAAIGVPLVLGAKALTSGIRMQPPDVFKVAMPVVWGLPDEQSRRPHADDYLYGDRLRPGDIVHIFGGFGIGAAEQARYTAAMQRAGYAYADKSRYQLDVRTAWQALRAIAAGLRMVAARHGRGLAAIALTHAPKGLHHYLRKCLELGNLRYRVQLVRDDYNPGHVIGTAVARARGVRTIAVQHNALPFESPQLAFMDADDLALYGDFYRRGYAPHWDRMRLHHTGRESLDWALEVKRDPARLAAVVARWRAVRPEPRRTALFLFPSERDITIPRHWRRMHAALEEVVSRLPSVDVVLRFRSAKSLAAPHVAPFADLPSTSPRVCVPGDDFTTYDLMAVSDLIVTYDGSFTVNEALAFGLPVFSFEFIGAGGYYFADYGRDFVLREPADVVRTVAALADGTIPALDVDWAALRRDLNCHADGHNRERLRTLVEQAAVS